MAGPPGVLGSGGGHLRAKFEATLPFSFRACNPFYYCAVTIFEIKFEKQG
jgi:hypothetical protein